MSSQFTFEAIGTWWQIDIYNSISDEKQNDLLSKIKSRIDVFDKNYSRFREDSLVTEISKVAGRYDMPEDAEKMFSLYYDLYILTGGMFTPLIGQTLVDAGYDAKYSLKQKHDLGAVPAWDESISYKKPSLVVNKPVLLDFGAAGKGYLIDIVAQLLEDNGIKHFCIDAGGDILHRNSEAISVGLEHPLDMTKVIGEVQLMNKSLCGSAGNRRKWQNFHHIIDPKKLSSPKNILAVWVLADTTIVADAIATCLFFVSADNLEKYDFEYLLIRDDLSIEKSQGFLCNLF